MRLAVALLVDLCFAGTTRAQTMPPSTPSPGIAQQVAPTYPSEETDRPLVLFPGMTVLDISVDFPQYNSTSVDAMGNKFVSKTFGHVIDITTSHAFGPMEVTARLLGNTFDGPSLFLGGATMLGPGAIDVVLSAQLPDSYIGRNDSEAIGYDYKAIVVPKRFAVSVGASISLRELVLMPAMQPVQDGYTASVGGGISAQVQITSRLAFVVGPGIFVPLAQSSVFPPSRTTIDVGSLTLLALGHWDLYGQFYVDDVTHGVYFFAAGGFVHRWGG